MSYLRPPLHPRTFVYGIVLAALFLAALPVAAGDAFLVADLDTTAGEEGPDSGCAPAPFGGPCLTTYRGSYPLGLVALGDEVVFAASDRVHGGELWRSDGTAAGARRITDLCPGPCNSVLTVLGRLDDEVFFWGSDDAAGPPFLWKTDGTAGGTSRVAEICTMRCDVAVHEWERSGQEVWPLSARGQRPLAATFDGRLYFFAAGDGSGVELWSTDGTPSGTFRMSDAGPGEAGWVPIFLLAADDGVYTVGMRSGSLFQTANEVWRSTGAPAAAERVFTSNASPTIGVLRLNDAVIFEGVLHVAMEGEEGQAPTLWAVGPEGGELVHRGSSIAAAFRDLTVAGERLYYVQVDHFARVDRSAGLYTLWVLEQPNPRQLSGRFDTLYRPAGVGERVYFGGNEERTGPPYRHHLYTAAGAQVESVPEYPGGSIYSVGPRSLDDSLLLVDGVGQDGSPMNVYTTYGSQGLRRLASMPGVATAGDWVAAGDHLFFAADDGERGWELWAVPRRALRPDASERLLGERFQVSVLFENQHAGGVVGSAVARPLTDDAARFWFFRPENTELVVKVLDGRGVNGHAWVFHGGTTNLGYRVTVHDRETGESRVYERAPGILCGGADAAAFDLVTPLAPLSAPAPAPFTPAQTAACDPASALCLGGGRFEVRVRFRDHHNGGEGSGVPVPDSDRAGWFWFFDDANLEVMAKVLDGRPVNGHFWVLWGGLTDLEYDLEVTDSATGTVRTYHHAPGDLCGGADTLAF